MTGEVESTQQKQGEIKKMTDDMDIQISNLENYIHKLKVMLEPVTSLSPKLRAEETEEDKSMCYSPLGQGLYLSVDRLKKANESLLEMIDECKL